MEQKLIGENIARFRTEKGLSQEKVAEYTGVSRQAVTKWEGNLSKPNSANLIRLAELFGISVDDLLGNQRIDVTTDGKKYKNSKMPWLFIVITLICIVAYIFMSAMNGLFRAGTLICMFLMGIPVQMFLHIYFTNAIDKDSISTVAGFDNNIEYDHLEVKRLLTQLDIHIGILSTVYVFLLCMIHLFDLEPEWINGVLILFYVLNILLCILINNYKVINKIYIYEADKKRALKGIPVTITYILLLFIGMGVTVFLFESKGIENNTMPAMKLAALLIFGAGLATIGYFVESNHLKKWEPMKSDYKISKFSLISAAASIILFGIMFVFT